MSPTKLAVHGGKKAVESDYQDIFRWPIVTEEDESAVLDVLRKGAMSGTEITKRFEKEYAEWQGSKHALGTCNGTAALLACMWACGLGAGDELIAPSVTYWASAAQALQLGAAVNFADIDKDTLCIDPGDIEHRIGPRTKAIMVVHYAGHPCDMDRILSIARKHNLRVIEDVSHAHGSLYKGKKVGTLGDIAGMSMMSGKSFAVGEAGMITTDNRLLYERCVSYGHYERTGVASRFNAADSQVRDAGLQRFAGIPLGAAKHRMNQTSAAMGLVQLKHYPARIQEIQDAINCFWDLLDGVPGIKANRPEKGSGSTMGGWYYPLGLYRGEELGGLSCQKFCEAVSAEGASCGAGANKPLHLHPYFHEADIFNMGKPTMISFGQRDVRQGSGSLPVAENIGELAYTIPWFKKFKKDVVKKYAEAYRKVAENADSLNK